MNLQMVSCNHHTADLAIRGRLGFPKSELGRAYDQLRNLFPQSELVVLSTCNRIEVYAAQEESSPHPTHRQLAEFLSKFHNVPLDDFFKDLFEQSGADVVKHLFQVAASVDSMVLGEPQIVAQVKEAYSQAQQFAATGPITNALFQRALGVAKRVRTETALAEGRVSIASVAVGEFGKSIFDRFDDKVVLVIGAGEMAVETLRYLHEEGAREIVVTNRTPERAHALAETWGGKVLPFEKLDEGLATADVIVTTTGAGRFLVDAQQFAKVRKKTGDKTVFILDLGVPRDFDPAIRDLDDNVFLYSIDDLQGICDKNREARSQELDKAVRIIDDETAKFLGELHHRATGPIIKRLREQCNDVKGLELEKLFARMPHLEKDRREIERSFDQVINKLLHPPLETLKDESRDGTPHGLLEALKRLFRLHD